MRPSLKQIESVQRIIQYSRREEIEKATDANTLPECYLVPDIFGWCLNKSESGHGCIDVGHS